MDVLCIDPYVGGSFWYYDAKCDYKTQCFYRDVSQSEVYMMSEYEAGYGTDLPQYIAYGNVPFNWVLKISDINFNDFSEMVFYKVFYPCIKRQRIESKNRACKQ